MKTFRITFPDLSKNKEPSIPLWKKWLKGIQIGVFGFLTLIAAYGPIFLLGLIFQGWRIGQNESGIGLVLDLLTFIYIIFGFPIMLYKAFYSMGFRLSFDPNKKEEES